MIADPHSFGFAEDDDSGEPSRPIEFVTLGNFLKADFPPAESLVGHARGGTNLLPRYGWVIPWGSEGSTKTTLLVDLVFHGASAREWLGYPIERALRFVVIVNEGVPGGLQDKLQQKYDCWDDPVVAERIAVYTSPWGEFTFQNERMRNHLWEFAHDFEADYIAADPLHTIGTTGSGTPEETEAFKHLLRDFGLWKWVGFLTPHHVNKGGKISGDWGRHPDTLIHVEKNGKQKQTIFTLEKARPADPDELNKPVILEWDTGTMGFERTAIDTRQKVSDDELLAGIYAELDKAASNGSGTVSMTDVRTRVTGNDDRIGALVRAEIGAGRIANLATKKGTYKLERGNRNSKSAAALWADEADDFE